MRASENEANSVNNSMKKINRKTESILRAILDIRLLDSRWPYPN